MRLTTTLAAATLCTLGLGAGTAAAAATLPAPPNPASINKQSQRQLQQLEQGNGLPQQAPVRKAPARHGKQRAAKGPTFLLRGVRVDATRFLRPAQVQAITSRYVGKTVDIATLRHMVDEINALLEKSSVVTASAYLPPQTIRGGVVHVAILQGRLGRLQVAGAKELKPAFVRSYVPVRPGQVINLSRVAHDLARFNDTGLARLQALVRPGARFGLTDIELAVTEPPRDLLQVFVDNEGVPTVGRNEIGALYQHYAPSGIDDRITLYALKSEGNATLSAAYDRPINALGGRAGFSVTSGSIRDIAGIYQALGITGWSESVSANAAQPLHVGRNLFVLGTASLTYEVSRSFEIGTTVASDSTRLESLGLRFGYTVPGMSAGATVANTFAQSHSNVSGANSHFDLLGGTFYLRRALTWGFVGSATGAWQLSSDEFIPGGQLFQVGGPTTVRGYPADALSGPTGYYANFAVHHALHLGGSRPIDGFLFVDQGGVFNHFPRYQGLRSVGAGCSWQLSRRVTARVVLGVPTQEVVYNQANTQIYLSLVARVL